MLALDQHWAAEETLILCIVTLAREVQAGSERAFLPGHLQEEELSVLLPSPFARLEEPREQRSRCGEGQEPGPSPSFWSADCTQPAVPPLHSIELHRLATVCKRLATAKAVSK